MIDDQGEMRLEVVEKRDRPTLTALLAKHTAIGSEVHTDSWRGYSSEDLGWAGFIHRTVNHSVELVAQDGTHTQRIESQWRVLRRHFNPGGIAKENITDYLLEYTWRKKCKSSNAEPFADLIKLARAKFFERLANLWVLLLLNIFLPMMYK